MRRLLFAYFLPLVVGIIAISPSVYPKDEDGHESHEEDGEADAVALSPEVLAKQGIVLKAAEARTIVSSFGLNGRMRANEDRLAHLVPRFSGIIKETAKRLGDKVGKGDLLMTVESNQTLQSYEVRAPISGVVVKRHATVGELVKEDESVFEIADLSELWADLYVFPSDFKRVREAQEVTILAADGAKVKTKIVFLSAHVDPTTQSKFARAVVNNEEGVFFPGQFVRGEIVESRYIAPVAVETSAIQTWEGKSVLFVPKGDAAAPIEVSLGSSDGQYTEVKTGLLSGAQYYTGDVFILKAELGKSLATHEH